ncbi:hypothetical protein XENTR_v10019332 [Xenopus tropicalis]|nr:hypothetical protein XENTR_v10019332 [Xenopus tropicalis]
MANASRDFHSIEEHHVCVFAHNQVLLLALKWAITSPLSLKGTACCRKPSQYEPCRLFISSFHRVNIHPQGPPGNTTHEGYACISSLLLCQFTFAPVTLSQYYIQ